MRTTPIINMFVLGLEESDYIVDDFHAGMAISSWYALYDIKAGQLGAKRDKLVELLGLKPNYHVNYEYRNAVWGLEINGHKCVLYTSIRGTDLQVEPKKWKPGEMQKLLKVLMDKLIDPEILKEDTEKVKFFLGMCALP